MSDTLIRGSAAHADCTNCPFSKDGGPNRPVFGEGPEDPKWIIIGEGPGINEQRLNRPFIGASGEVVNKILAKIGRPRIELWVTNATLCLPPRDAAEADRDRAAVACKPRLRAELAQFATKPVFTLGAVAARAVIPKESLDAIDPPEAPKVIRRQQKLNREPMLKAARMRQKAIDKIAIRRLAKMIKHFRSTLIKQAKAKYRAVPSTQAIQNEIYRVQGQLKIKARHDAGKEYDLKKKERELKRLAKANKPRKPKRVKITDICGTLFDVDIDGSGVRPLIPGIHPAALLRGGGASIAGSHTPDMAFVNLIWDAAKVDALAHGKDIRLKLLIEWELYDQAKAVELFLKVFHEALAEGSCSIDLETYVDDPDRHHALMAHVAQIRVIGIATNQRSVSIAWDLIPDWGFSYLQALLALVEVGYHNGLYDRTVLRAYGFEMGPRWFDTLLAHHAAFPGNSHRLQHVVTQFFATSPWKSEFRNSEETADSLAVYNAKDTGGTHAVRVPLLVHIKRTSTERVYEIDKKMSDMASRMHLAGIPIDRDINHELMAGFSANLSEARDSVEEIARDPKLREQIWHYLAIAQASTKRKLDPSDYEDRYKVRLAEIKHDSDWGWKIESGKHIAALLQATGISLYQTTDRGQLSTKKDILEGLAEHAIVRDILNYRENAKLYSTFVAPMYDRFDRHGNLLAYGYADERGRVHPIWNVHRISGRWASAWPVVSNVPKDKWKKLIGDALMILLDVELPKEGILTLPSGTIIRVNKKDKSVSKLVRPNLRRQVKVRKGRRIVGFDYEQIEARVIALISGDPFMCEVFADSTRDIHIECARMIFAAFDSLDPDTQGALRETVKPIEYGFFYLAQVETLHRQLLKEGINIKLADLAKAISKLQQLMAGVVRWQRKSVAMASQPPYEIRDFVLGRRRVWPLGQAEATEACNSGVQPTASAIMNLGMAQFMERSMGNYQELDPLAQVHDAAYFECWEDDEERLKADIKRDFPQEYTVDGRTIYFGVKVKSGESWDQV